MKQFRLSGQVGGPPHREIVAAVMKGRVDAVESKDCATHVAS